MTKDATVLQRLTSETPSAATIPGLCRVFGHELDNRLVADGGPRCRRCHGRILFEDGRITHTRHVLGCLLRHHTYLRIGRRAGHNEYACIRCGHSFLLAQDGVRRVHHPLVCRASGQRVAFVEQRGNYREHRCVRCGHPFLCRL